MCALVAHVSRPKGLRRRKATCPSERSRPTKSMSSREFFAYPVFDRDLSCPFGIVTVPSGLRVDISGYSLSHRTCAEVNTFTAFIKGTQAH